MILNYCLSSFMRTNFNSKNYFIKNLIIWKISDRNDKQKKLDVVHGDYNDFLRVVEDL